MKKLFAVLFAVGLLFAISGTSMARWTQQHTDRTTVTSYNDWESKVAEGYAGGQFTDNHGSFGVNADSSAYADGYQTQVDTITETTYEREYTIVGWGHHCGWLGCSSYPIYGWGDWHVVDRDVYTQTYHDNLSATADAFATGDTHGGDFLIGGPNAKLGVSYGKTTVLGSSWGLADPGFDGSANTSAHVDGYADQWNDINFTVGDMDNGAGAGGGNYTYGDFSGDDYGSNYAGVSGGADACGFSVGRAIVDPGNFAAARAITYGQSSAWQNGAGVTSVYGEGSVSHGTWLSGPNFNGGTSGNAAFTYSGNGTNYTSGEGIAYTYGTISVGSNGFTAHSHSYANGGCVD